MEEGGNRPGSGRVDTLHSVEVDRKQRGSGKVAVGLNHLVDKGRRLRLVDLGFAVDCKRIVVELGELAVVALGRFGLGLGCKGGWVFRKA